MTGETRQRDETRIVTKRLTKAVVGRRAGRKGQDGHGLGERETASGDTNSIDGLADACSLVAKCRFGGPETLPNKRMQRRPRSRLVMR